MIQKIDPGFVLVKTGYLTINTVEESINKTLALLSLPSEFAQIISIQPVCSLDQILFAPTPKDTQARWVDQTRVLLF